MLRFSTLVRFGSDFVVLVATLIDWNLVSKAVGFGHVEVLGGFVVLGVLDQLGGSYPLVLLCLRIGDGTALFAWSSLGVKESLTFGLYNKFGCLAIFG
ncbi:hypothetical protein V6N13_102168 [Hibiscus sabdariffa]|uniref:Uncharacterized protein n=1 Tax=Hibiscus sabdariffa TaxID=183260 RepID=A0ABR2D370_9ROSI